MQEFNPVLLDINKDAKNVVLTGDFNIGLLKLNSNEKFQELYDTNQNRPAACYNTTHKNVNPKCNTDWPNIM